MAWVPDVWRRATRHLRHLPTTVVIGNDRSCGQPIVCGVDGPPTVLRDRPAYRLLLAACGQIGRLVPIEVSVCDSSGAEAWARSRIVAFVFADAECTAADAASAAEDSGRCGGERSCRASLFALSASAGECWRDAQLCGVRGGRTSIESFAPRLGGTLQPKAAPMLGYVSRGYYALQLELLLKLYPRNKVLIVDAENLRADAAWHV